MSLENSKHQDSTSMAHQVFACVHCGSAIKAGRKFCSRCGAPVVATSGREHPAGLQQLAAVAPAGRNPVRQLSICPECGFENHHSDRFCKTCGGLLAVSSVDTVTHAVDAVDTRLTGTLAQEQKPGAGTQAVAAARPAVIPDERKDIAAATESVPSFDGAEAGISSSSISALDGGAQPEPPGRASAGAVVPLAPPPLQEVKPGFLQPRNLGFTGATALLIAGVLLLHSHSPKAGGVKAPSLTSSSLAATPTSSFVPVEASDPAPVERSSRSSRATAKTAAAAPVKKISGAQSSPSQGRELPAALPSNPGGSHAGLTELAPTVAVAQPTAPPAAAPAAVTPSTSDAATTSMPAIKQPDSGVPVTMAANLAVLTPMAPEPAAPKPAPLAAAAAPPAAAPRPSARPLRVGGNVQAYKLLSKTEPVYPPAAIQTNVQGVVRLTAVIAKDGTVRDLKVISGNKLLAGAALNAVRAWRYQPTELNGEPVEISTEIDLDFRLP